MEHELTSRERGYANLRPIKKGEIRRKGKIGKNLWRWAGRLGPPDKFIEPMRKLFGLRKGSLNVEEAIILRLVLEACRGDLKAVELWMDRKYGKVTQPMDISTENGPLVAILNAPQGGQTIHVTTSPDDKKKVIDITPPMTPLPPAPKTQEPQDP